MRGMRAGPGHVDVDAWRRTGDGQRAWGPIGLAALVLLSLAASWAPHASADPQVVDKGGGVKLAIWDFASPAEYATDNVSLAPAHAALAWHVVRPTHASDADLASADSVANVTRVLDSVRLD